MGLFLENFGLDDFYNEDTLRGLAGYSIQNGKLIPGYYDIPYLYHGFGDMEIAVTLNRNEDGTYLVVNQDSHCRGNCLWDAVLSDVDISPLDQNPLARRVMIQGANGMQNLAVVNLIHADVLPSFLGGDEVKMQIVGFPAELDLYETADSYMDAQEEWRDGKKLGLADGLIFPTGMMHNHSLRNPEHEKNPDQDSYHVMRGSITKLLWGRLIFEKVQEEKAFLMIYVMTRLGELQLIYPAEKIKEEKRRLLKPGTVVDAVIYLSADVAIGEYKNGRILDEEHDLSLLRYSMLKGDAERLRFALTDDAVYRAELPQETYCGPDAIIIRIEYVKEENPGVYDIRKGTITCVDDGEELLPYGVGKRCLVLYDKEHEEPESICFIQTDEEGKITEILTTPEKRYHFSLDKLPVLKMPIDETEEGDQ